MSGVSEPDDTLPEHSVNSPDDTVTSSVSGSAVCSPRRREVASSTTSQGATMTPVSSVNRDEEVEQSQSSVHGENVNIPHRRNPSRNKRRQFSDQWSVPSLQKVYCVCRKPWKGEAMIQCESCDIWYHCSCLQIDPIVSDKFAGNDVQFLCGQNGCNNGNMFLQLPHNAESCDILSTSSVAPSDYSESMSHTVSNSKLVTASNCESVTTPNVGDTVSQNELVFPRMLQCNSCELWYNCTCATVDTAVCSRFDGVSTEFLCGKKGCNSGTMVLRLPDNVMSDNVLLTNVGVSGNDSMTAAVTNSELVTEHSIDGGVAVVISGLHNDAVVSSHAVFNVPADVTDTTVESVLCDDLGSSVLEIDPYVPSSTRLDVPAAITATTVDSVLCNDLSSLPPQSDVSVDLTATANPVVDENVMETTMLSNECVERILGCPAPQSNVYEQQLQTYAEFDIPGDMLSKLRVPNSRYLVRGCWQSVFLEGLKKSNSLCVLCFRYHSACATGTVHRSNKVFHARGYCSVPGCPVQFTLEMYDEVTVHVYYTGNIKHPLCGQWARPISGLERNRLQEQFAHGRKPFSVYVEKLNMKTGSELLAGNYDHIGKSSHVLRKISSEGVHSKQLHPDVYQSLLKLQECANDSVSSHYGIKTFVQSVSIAPVIVHLWTESGVRLYHQLSCCNALFLDATGSVVRKIPNCKRILYYEMSIRNPSGSGCSIPVAAMLASDHTVSAISHFLQTFRDAEKRIFGFRSLVVPVVVKIDFSMALLSSILMVYNRQDVHEYLQWSWETVNDCSTTRRCHTVVHVCLAHFVKCVKLQCSKIFKGATELVLYTMSLMSAAHNLLDVGELFHDLCVILCSVHTTDMFSVAFARLQFKIAAYDPKHVVLASMLESEAENDTVYVADVRGSEDRVMSRCPTSPFLSWASSVYATTRDRIKLNDKADLPPNRFCNVALLEHLLKLYMPTLPVWSNVLVSVYLTVANKTCSHARKTNASDILPRTSGTQEQRFYVLKHLVLGNKSTRRMDEFVQCVSELFTAAEKEFAVTYLRNQRKRTSTAATLPVQENWAKKQKQPPCLLNPKLGKYQQPPTKRTIKDLNAVISHGVKPIIPVSEHTGHVYKVSETSTKSVVFAAANFSPMTNFGNTCWFNAAMQALHKTDVCLTIVEHFESVIDLDSNHVDRNQPLHASLCAILRFMTHEAPNPVPRAMILRCIALYNRSFDQRRIGTKTQHDVHEFLTDCIFTLFAEHSVCPQFVQEITCTTCGEPSSTQREETCPCLMLAIPDSSMREISVQQLVDDYCAGHSVSAVCSSKLCKSSVQNKIVINRFTRLPDSVIILLQRYKQCGRTVIKRNINVLINRYVKLHCIDFNSTVSSQECTFSLCSVVSHVGSSPHCGHYTASVLQEREDGSVSFVVCDDSIVNIVGTQCVDGNIMQSDDRTVNNAVILMYNRQFVGDKRLLPLLVGLQRTTGLASLFDAMQATSFGATQQRFSIVSDMLSGKHSDTLLSSISRITRFDLTDFSSCKVLISTLISDLVCTLDLRCNTFFLHSSNIAEGRECSSGRTVLFLESDTVIPSHSHSLELCFFPDSIIFLSSESTPLQQMLNLSASIHHVFPSQTLLYEFVGAITWQNNSIVFCDSLNCIDPSASILLYNIKKELYCSMVIAPNKCLINKQLPHLKLAPDNFTLAQVEHVARSYCGVVLSSTHWHSIMSRQWFTDVIIDSYFILLARHVSDSVLVYSCSFFNTFFFKQNPYKPKVSLFRKEHSKNSWFSVDGDPLFHFVVIPGSLLNAHFVAIVIDLHTQCIFVCDPMQIPRNKVVYQVARYMCQEYFLSTGTALDIKKLSLLNYCSWDSDFPRQCDTHNCGAYICLIVKCIVQNKLLRFQKPELLRKTVCFELLHNKLL